MKRLIVTILCAMAFCVPSMAQGINDKADNIIGEYLTDRGGSKSKVRVTKNADGTYNAQVFWVENPNDANGNKRKDVKNPDKSLRNVDIDKVILVDAPFDVRLERACKRDGADRQKVLARMQNQKLMNDLSAGYEDPRIDLRILNDGTMEELVCRTRIAINSLIS